MFFPGKHVYFLIASFSSMGLTIEWQQVSINLQIIIITQYK